jgi:hypothetical protein
MTLKVRCNKCGAENNIITSIAGEIDAEEKKDLSARMAEIRIEYLKEMDLARSDYKTIFASTPDLQKKIKLTVDYDVEMRRITDKYIQMIKEA